MRKAKRVQSGQSQEVRIPKSLAIEGITEVSLRRDGEKLIVEPSRKSWLTLLRVKPGDGAFMAERPTFMESQLRSLNPNRS